MSILTRNLVGIAAILVIVLASDRNNLYDSNFTDYFTGTFQSERRCFSLQYLYIAL